MDDLLNGKKKLTSNGLATVGITDMEGHMTKPG